MGILETFSQMLTLFKGSRTVDSKNSSQSVAQTYSTVHILLKENLQKVSPDGPILDSRTCCRKKPEIIASPVFRYSTVYILKGNVRNAHQMAPFCSRTVAPASRSHFQIFYSDNYWKGILETFTRWSHSAPELLLLLLRLFSFWQWYL